MPRTLLFAVVMAAHAAALHSAKPAPRPAHPTVSKPMPTPASTPGFGVSLTLDNVAYAVPVTQNSITHLHATLVLFNHTHAPLSLTIGGQLYNWEILDASGQVVWDYAKGRMFPHYLRRLTLQQGELTYADDIPLQSQDGVPLAPGSYVLRGTLPHILNASATVAFTITR